MPLEEQTILLAGLQGSGKTTSAAKMAWWFSTKGLRPAVIQTDTFRPGAYEQAQEMAGRAEVDYYGNPDSEDPVEIARKGLEETSEADVHIVDTAGRHALEDDLIDEIEQIEGVADPDTSCSYSTPRSDRVQRSRPSSSTSRSASTASSSRS